MMSTFLHLTVGCFSKARRNRQRSSSPKVSKTPPKMDSSEASDTEIPTLGGNSRMEEHINSDIATEDNLSLKSYSDGPLSFMDDDLESELQYLHDSTSESYYPASSEESERLGDKGRLPGVLPGGLSNTPDSVTVSAPTVLGDPSHRPSSRGVSSLISDDTPQLTRRGCLCLPKSSRRRKKLSVSFSDECQSSRTSPSDMASDSDSRSSVPENGVRLGDGHVNQVENNSQDIEPKQVENEAIDTSMGDDIVIKVTESDSSENLSVKDIYSPDDENGQQPVELAGDKVDDDMDVKVDDIRVDLDLSDDVQTGCLCARAPKKKIYATPYQYGSDDDVDFSTQPGTDGDRTSNHVSGDLRVRDTQDGDGCSEYNDSGNSRSPLVEEIREEETNIELIDTNDIALVNNETDECIFEKTIESSDEIIYTGGELEILSDDNNVEESETLQSNCVDNITPDLDTIEKDSYDIDDTTHTDTNYNSIGEI